MVGRHPARVLSRPSWAYLGRLGASRLNLGRHPGAVGLAYPTTSRGHDDPGWILGVAALASLVPTPGRSWGSLLGYHVRVFLRRFGTFENVT